MAIKLDLEKAYDKLEWSFIRKKLIRFNFLENLIELIMSCISSVSTSLLFNGGCMDSFWPSRGIRQGDPLSLYLFILCMEFLGQLIDEKCSEHLWTKQTSILSSLFCRWLGTLCQSYSRELQYNKKSPRRILFQIRASGRWRKIPDLLLTECRSWLKGFSSRHPRVSNNSKPRKILRFPFEALKEQKPWFWFCPW